MPYAPGVQDMRGAYRAQGISGAADAISRGILQYQQQRDEDKKLLARARSTEAFVKSHPDLFGGEAAVNEMLTPNPKESAAAKYERLAQVVQNAVVGEKLGAERQQMEAMKQQMAAAEQARKLHEFQLVQAQAEAQREEMQRQRLQQALGTFSPQGGGQPPVSADPENARGAAAQLGGAVMAAQNQPAPGMAAPQANNPFLMQAAQYQQAFGNVPDRNAAAAMIGNSARQEIADERNQTRAAIERAKREMDQANLDLKKEMSEPRYHTDLETGIRSVWTGAQWTPLPGQVAKSPEMIEIDRLEKAGDLTHAAAVKAKKALLNHKSQFSPNSATIIGGQLAGITGPSSPGAPGVDIFAEDAPAPAAGARDYATPEELMAAVRGLSIEEAKAIAKRKGWSK